MSLAQYREDENQKPRASPYVLSTKKAKDLGVDFQPLEEVLQEMVASFKDKKFLT